MGRKSVFRLLPKEIVVEIDNLLREDRATLDEILEHLRALGVDIVSRSVLGTRKQKVEAEGRFLRESRELVDSLIRAVGPSATEGAHGRLLVETLRNLAHDHLRAMRDGSGGTSQEFMHLAKALKDMAQANRLDQDFESKVRERVEKEVKAKMDKAVETVMSAQGSGKLDVEQVKASIKAAYGTGE